MARHLIKMTWIEQMWIPHRITTDDNERVPCIDQAEIISESIDRWDIKIEKEKKKEYICLSEQKLSPNIDLGG